MVDIPSTFGAMMVGGIVAAVFSGIVISQSFSYFKYYSNDSLGLKLLVGSVCFLDTGHTIFVTMSLWDHLIHNFGNVLIIDFVPWSLALTIAFTALLTLIVQLFFIHRIFKLSHEKLTIAIPLVLMACGRLCFAALTTVKLISLRSLTKFSERYTWSFTTGLGLSAILDVLLFVLLLVLLKKKKRYNSSMNDVLDTLMLHAFENGALTCVAAILSLICWLVSHKNLVFMAIHFVISKFYASSLLATLNARKELHPLHRSKQSVSLERGCNATSVVAFFDEPNPSRTRHSFLPENGAVQKIQTQLSVKRRTVSNADDSKLEAPSGLSGSTTSINKMDDAGTSASSIETLPV